MYIHTSQTNDHGNNEYNKIRMQIMYLLQMTSLGQLYLCASYLSSLRSPQKYIYDGLNDSSAIFTASNNSVSHKS